MSYNESDISLGRAYLPQYLREAFGIDVPDSMGKNFECPIHHGVSMHYYHDSHTVTCYGCDGTTKNGKNGIDIYDLIGKIEGLNFCESVERVFAMAGIARRINTYSAKTKSKYKTPPEPEVDYTADYEVWHRDIGLTEYPQLRGLTPEVIDRFNLGYVADWRHPKVPATAPTSPRLIIPISKHSYLARDTRSDLEQIESQKEHTKMWVGSGLFNADALYQDRKPIFIVEGAIDAMSIMVAGGEAIATNSISWVNKVWQLIDRLLDSRGKPTQPLIIALDNDKPKPGEEKTQAQKHADSLEKELKSRGIICYQADVVNLYGIKGEGEVKEPAKDANEALQTDKDFFAERITYEEIRAYSIKEDAEAEKRATEAAELADYLAKAVPGRRQTFDAAVEANKRQQYIQIGGDNNEFHVLAEVLDGGLYDGLYVIGAIPALGKTTFALQIADNISQAGMADVMIFSLEMSEEELMARSISRLTAKNYGLGNLRKIEEFANLGELDKATIWPRTTRQIMANWKYDGKDKESIDYAVDAYFQTTNRLRIIEGNGELGVEKILEAVDNHVEKTGNYPVVIVDYLQILAPFDQRASDKQNTDKAVLELKRISRKYRIPVIAIASFNRNNYQTRVSMQAFKESGAIEYAADILIGMEMQIPKIGKENDKGETITKEERQARRLQAIEKAKKTPVFPINLHVLKNRNGQAGKIIQYGNCARYNMFVEGYRGFAELDTDSWDEIESVKSGDEQEISEY